MREAALTVEDDITAAWGPRGALSHCDMFTHCQRLSPLPYGRPLAAFRSVAFAGLGVTLGGEDDPQFAAGPQ